MRLNKKTMSVIMLFFMISVISFGFPRRANAVIVAVIGFIAGGVVDAVSCDINLAWGCDSNGNPNPAPCVPSACPTSCGYSGGGDGCGGTCGATAACCVPSLCAAPSTICAGSPYTESACGTSCGTGTWSTSQYDSYSCTHTTPEIACSNDANCAKVYTKQPICTGLRSCDHQTISLDASVCVANGTLDVDGVHSCTTYNYQCPGCQMHVTPGGWIEVSP